MNTEQGNSWCGLVPGGGLRNTLAVWLPPVNTSTKGFKIANLHNRASTKGFKIANLHNRANPDWNPD